MTKLVVVAEHMSSLAVSQLLAQDPCFAPSHAFADQANAVDIVSLMDEPLALHRRLRRQPSSDSDILYVRPRVFRYPDALAALVFPLERHADFFEVLAAVDLLLSNCLIVELEDLHHRPEQSLPILFKWLGRSLLQQHYDGFGAGAYGRAMAAIFENARHPSICLAALLPLGEQQLMNEGSLANLMLKEGWYQPESHFTWSVAPSSRIHLPLPANKCKLQCTLSGFKMRSDVLITIFVNDTPADALFFMQDDGVSLRAVFALVITPACTSADIELRFSHTVCPNRLDPMNGDYRELAFAVTAIELDQRVCDDLKSPWRLQDVLDLDLAKNAIITLPSHVDIADFESALRQGARIVAQDVVGIYNEQARSADLPVSARQESLETFFARLVERRRRVHLTISPERIEDFLHVTNRFKGFEGWVSISFLLEDLQNNSSLLQWMTDHHYMLLIDMGRVLAFHEGSIAHG